MVDSVVVGSVMKVLWFVQLLGHCTSLWNGGHCYGDIVAGMGVLLVALYLAMCVL